MFKKLGGYVINYRVWVTVAWVVVGAYMALYAPSLTKVGTSDETSFLPMGTESIRARDLIASKFPNEAAAGSSVIVFYNPGGLSDRDIAYAREVHQWLLSKSAPEEVEKVVSIFDQPEMRQLLISADNTAMMMQVNLKVAPFQTSSNATVEAIRDHLGNTQGGPETYVTGQAGIGADLIKALIQGADRTTVITLVLVLLVLLAVYRSPVASLVPLITIGLAFLVSRGTLGYLAQSGIRISSLLDSFIVVLVFGVGTDYSLVIVSRFREELARLNRHDAAVATIDKIGPVIAASAATVILGLSCLAVARFELTKTIGPALGLTVFITLVIALTLTPALLSLFGRYAFWPFPEVVRSRGAITFWQRVADAVTRHPLPVAVAIIALLLVPYMFLPGSARSFDLLAQLPEQTDSVRGFKVIEKHFDKGQMMPVSILIDSKRDLSDPGSLAAIARVSETLRRVEGVQKVQAITSPEGNGQTPAELKASGQLRQLSDGLAGRMNANVSPKELLAAQPEKGLDSVDRYLADLAEAFPQVRDDSNYKQAAEALRQLRSYMDDARRNARVDYQLLALASQLDGIGGAPVSPAANPADTSGDPSVLAAYLAQLGQDYPELKQEPTYNDAVAKAQQLVEASEAARLLPRGAGTGPQAAAQQADMTRAISQFSEDLKALATLFAGRSDAYFFPAGGLSLEGKAERDRLLGLLTTLQSGLNGLAGSMDSVGNDYFLPNSLLESSPQAQDLLHLFYSSDRRTARFFMITRSDPYSTSAFDTVSRVREALKTELAASSLKDTSIYVGGPTAEFADIQRLVDEDFIVVMALVVVGVFGVMAILLRSLVAPAYLVLSVMLSYGTALGLSTILFQDILGQPGVNYIVPILIFVLLVALGADYNIFLMSRVREESVGRTMREGVRRAAAVTGGIITACGLILAGTFGALMSAPIQMLFQVGAAVAIGVLIDTFVVRALLVPAIAATIGNWNWWPNSHPNP